MGDEAILVGVNLLEGLLQLLLDLILGHTGHGGGWCGATGETRQELRRKSEVTSAGSEGPYIPTRHQEEVMGCLGGIDQRQVRVGVT